MGERIQLRRTPGWRLPPGATSVARPTKWGNPFRYRRDTGLCRYPAALGDGEWEYEGRISADGMRITWATAWSVPLPATPPDPVVFGEPGPASEYAAASRG